MQAGSATSQNVLSKLEEAWSMKNAPAKGDAFVGSLHSLGMGILHGRLA
jgi:hypothetical protein